MSEPVTFLSLPRDVRVKIYKLSRISRFCPIDLMVEGRRMTLGKGFMQGSVPGAPVFFDVTPDSRCWYRSRLGRAEYGEDDKRRPYLRQAPHGNPRCFCAPLPMQLFRVSKFIHDEVEVLFYQSNRFSISQGEPAIRKINKFQANMALGKSRDLQSADAQNYLLRSLSVSAVRNLKSLDLNLGVIAGSEDIARCSDLCNFLSANVNLPQFYLGIVAATTPETAPVVLEKLSKLKQLKDCSISLRDEHNDKLARLVKETVMRLTGKSEPLPSEPFPYSRLPAEIRIRILYFTDLLPINPEESHYDQVICVRDGGLVHPSHNNSLVRPINKCCLGCSNSLGWGICECFSRKRGYSSRCNPNFDCFILPVGLFRVSRLLNSDATYTFYTYNRFMLGKGSFRSYLAFLQNLSSTALRSMSSLHLTLGGGLAPDCWDPAGHTWSIWNTLIEFVAQNCDLSRLHLSIDSGYYGSDLMDGSYETSTYPMRDFAKPFHHLRGLKSFHIFLAHADEEVEARVERIVMGEGYNSLYNGKPAFEERGDAIMFWRRSERPAYDENRQVNGDIWLWW